MGTFSAPNMSLFTQGRGAGFAICGRGIDYDNKEAAMARQDGTRDVTLETPLHALLANKRRVSALKKLGRARRARRAHVLPVPRHRSPSPCAGARAGPARSQGEDGVRRARAQRACQPDERARRLPCGSARRRRRVRRDAPCARFAGHARVLLASQIVRGLARRPLARRRPRGDCRGSDHVYGPSAIHPPPNCSPWAARICGPM